MVQKKFGLWFHNPEGAAFFHFANSGFKVNHYPNIVCFQPESMKCSNRLPKSALSAAVENLDAMKSLARNSSLGMLVSCQQALLAAGFSAD